MRKLQVIVVPFNLRKGVLRPDTPLAAKSDVVGIATADRIAHLFDGVGVFGVYVDDITGDASDLHELHRVGEVPSLDEFAVAA